nr:immunoglobulin light chain junction region [Macaca mulatta]MOX79440.1 immunoglobulin light chain junction region [Macaca mulatta]MOX79675.1 immunoglobulin light chain junction region [Macaca mulatta]MOX79962.1 immunoglobulin light chain junction region [Macaca mulatta]MOX81002.1 immunoglobulin light chain junction region [Macaca mulatta]
DYYCSSWDGSLRTWVF